MKIAEMIKKIETYNEVAEMIGTNKAELKIKAGYTHSVRVGSYKEIKRYIKEEYIECIAKAILSCDEYQFRKEIKIEAIDVFGDKIYERVEFYAE